MVQWRKEIVCVLLGTMLLCACGKNSMIVENRNLTLEPFVVDFLGEYRIEHMFIDGSYGINRCYANDPLFPWTKGHGKFIYYTNRDGNDYPALVTPRVPSGIPMYSELMGSKEPPHWWPRKAKKRMATTGEVRFVPLCSANFYGGNGISFGIRSSANQSIEGYLTWIQSVITGPNRRYRNSRFIQEPHVRNIGSITWMTYTASVRKGIVEAWLTPIGDSGYYIYIGSVLSGSENDREYQAARRLFDGIIQSVVIEPQSPGSSIEAPALEQTDTP